MLCYEVFEASQPAVQLKLVLLCTCPSGLSTPMKTMTHARWICNQPLILPPRLVLKQTLHMVLLSLNPFCSDPDCRPHCDHPTLSAAMVTTNMTTGQARNSSQFCMTIDGVTTMIPNYQLNLQNTTQYMVTVVVG